ncbi:hypothetical protein ZWY2020_019232 [Hordeum vulgare]|nr:hypothetical protein ZWY2020_019232 [Hordeum vulgare]
MAPVIPTLLAATTGATRANDGDVYAFHEVDNWLGICHADADGSKSLEAPLVKSSPPGCSMGCTLGNENYMNTQESCIVKDSDVQIKINDRKAQLERSRIQRESDLNHFEGDIEVSEFCSDNFVHSDGSADEVVQMEIDSASEEDRPLELTALDQSAWTSAVLKFILWLAYLMADSTAVYTLGHLSISGSLREQKLTVFWAPFLLHLGSQDTIIKLTPLRTTSSGHATC